MKNINVENLVSRVNLGDYADRLNDYRGSDSYICDIIAEIADSATSIYYSDIIKFISENVEAVNDTIKEFGWDGCGCDLYKAGQMAECQMIERDIYEHLPDALRVLACDYLRYDLGIEEIPEELADVIAEHCDALDSCVRAASINEIIDEWYEEHDMQPGCVVPF